MHTGTDNIILYSAHIRCHSGVAAHLGRHCCKPLSLDRDCHACTPPWRSSERSRAKPVIRDGLHPELAATTWRLYMGGSPARRRAQAGCDLRYIVRDSRRDGRSCTDSVRYCAQLRPVRHASAVAARSSDELRRTSPSTVLTSTAAQRRATNVITKLVRGMHTANSKR